MPTKPLESILDRELSKAAAKDVIEIASPLLQELVNFATHALVRCATSTSGKEDEHVAILALYRHIFEMTDGIEVLISQSCSMPAVPLLRSSFEALLSIEYILERDKDYTCRSLSWLVGYVHKRLDMYERLDPSTTKGRQFRKSFGDDKFVSNVSLPPPAEAQRAKANLQSMLAKPHLQPIEAEFSRHKSPRWYQLFGGPRSLETLAQYLRRGGQYDILYRQWSTASHAQDLLPFIAKTANDEPTIGRLRDPSKIKEIACYASYFVLRATRLVIEKLRPGEDLAGWYKREVRERYLFIAKAT